METYSNPSVSSFTKFGDKRADLHGKAELLRRTAFWCRLVKTEDGSRRFVVFCSFDLMRWTVWRYALEASAVTSTMVYALSLLHKVGVQNCSIPCIKRICIREKLRVFRSFSPQKWTTQWTAGHSGLRESLLIAEQGCLVLLD